MRFGHLCEEKMLDPKGSDAETVMNMIESAKNLLGVSSCPGYYNLGFITFFKGNKRAQEATSKLSTFEIETVNGDFTFH